MNIPKDYEEFFALLNKEKVRYLIVGAYAMAYHAQPRFTGDIDIFIEVDKTNAKRLLNAVEKFGFKNSGLTSVDFLKPDQIVQLGYPPLRIDILTSIDGVSFGIAWERRVRAKFGKQKVWYISKRDLIRNKKAAGRTRDLLDLELIKTGGKFR